MGSSTGDRAWAPCCAATLLALVLAPTTVAQGADMRSELDPVTRQFRVSYTVPAGAPEAVTIRCSWSPAGQGQWRPAKVIPFMSDTALRLLPEEPEGFWRQWVTEGKLTELRAAGLERSVVFNPYPEAQPDGRVDCDFRVQIETPAGEVLATHETRLQADNTDVVYLEDWSRVLQPQSLAEKPAREDRKWEYRTGLPEGELLSLGSELYGLSPSDLPLPGLTYPLDLRGPYAIFVCTRARHGIGLRLTGDERTDGLGSRHPTQEMLWRWCRMDRQHLVIENLQSYAGYSNGQLDYVKLVPLSDETLQALEGQFAGPRDKLVAGYFEPYSWAFSERVTETLQHREPLVAFAEAGVQILDAQMGRFGARVNYESRIADQLWGTTFGDPIGHVERPTTDNVGMMQQFTNTCDAELRYARELGMMPHANFGATNCYPNSPLEGRISREHPEWRRGSTLRYEVPEVRAYILSLYREVLEIGAPGISIDFCRYPEGVDQAETLNGFLRELRQLADEVGRNRGQKVPILIRFPAKGVRLWERFDYATWVREGLADYLCPSNIQGRHHHFDIAPYVEAVRGSQCKLLPVVDGLHWGPEMPGPFLWRVQQLYKAGVDGIYVYQADARILGRMEDRRVMRLLGSSSAVARWWEREDALRPQYSKGIYITPYGEEPGYHGWQRLRVWTDGIEMGPMEFYLDDKLVHRCEGPPYLLGTEEYESDSIIPTGPHTLRIRAQDGDGWLEQTFQINGA